MDRALVRLADGAAPDGPRLRRAARRVRVELEGDVPRHVAHRREDAARRPPTRRAATWAPASSLPRWPLLVARSRAGPAGSAAAVEGGRAHPQRREDSLGHERAQRHVRRASRRRCRGARTRGWSSGPPRPARSEHREARERVEICVLRRLAVLARVVELAEPRQPRGVREELAQRDRRRVARGIGEAGRLGDDPGRAVRRARARPRRAARGPPAPVNDLVIDPMRNTVSASGAALVWRSATPAPWTCKSSPSTTTPTASPGTPCSWRSASTMASRAPSPEASSSRRWRSVKAYSGSPSAKTCAGGGARAAVVDGGGGGRGGTAAGAAGAHPESAIRKSGRRWRAGTAPL